MKARTMSQEIKLPRWEAAHKRLGTEYVDSGFLSDIPEKVTEGYAVIRPVEGEAPYLIVVNRGSVHEIGRVEKSHGNQNIGTAYTGVSPDEVRQALECNEGEISVYELPEEVAENICKVINSESRYGDLKTDIVDVNEVFRTLEEDSFSGNVVFTNSSNYSFVELRNGEVTNCWHRGDAGCSTTADLRATQFDEGLEVNIFEKEDIRRSGRSLIGGGRDDHEPSEDAEIDNQNEDSEEVTVVDYTGIVESIADTLAAVVGRDKFYESLSNSLSDTSGVFIENGRVVAENPDRERVFEGIETALKESTEMMTPEAAIEKARDDIESVRGGEEFLTGYK